MHGGANREERSDQEIDDDEKWCRRFWKNFAVVVLQSWGRRVKNVVAVRKTLFRKTARFTSCFPRVIRFLGRNRYLSYYIHKRYFGIVPINILLREKNIFGNANVIKTIHVMHLDEECNKIIVPALLRTNSARGIIHSSLCNLPRGTTNSFNNLTARRKKQLLHVDVISIRVKMNIFPSLKTKRSI